MEKTTLNFNRRDTAKVARELIGKTRLHCHSFERMKFLAPLKSLA